MAELRNDCVSLTLDDRGSLASLRNLRTGCEYVARPGLDLWQLIYPTDDDPETPVRASEQDPPEVAAEGDSLTVTYPVLRDFQGLRVEAELQYRVELAGEELIFTSRLTNRRAARISELWFPMINGLGNLGDDPAAAFLLYPESAGRRILDPLHHLADRDAQPVRGVRFNFLRDFYPGRASMQWMGLYGEGGSLYVGSHDSSLQTTATNAMLNVGASPEEDSLSLGFIKYPFVRAGETWESAPFVVAVHAEDWRRDARRYRAFCDTYQDHTRSKPQWVEDMPAMQDIVMMHQHGRVKFRYDQIGEIAAAAKTGGIDVVKLTGWSHGGHDNMLPDFYPSDRLGGETVLVENFRRVQDDGYRMVLYFHFIQMSPNSEFYAQHGEFCAIKGPYGNPFIDIFTWPSHGSIIGMNERFQLINACCATEPWHEQVLRCVRRGLDWGVDCVFLDQVAGAPSSFLCFDERHGHRSPAYSCGPGKTELSRKAREMVKAEGEEIALGAEYIADVILQYYDFTLPFGLGFFYGEQHFGELYRYTFPEDILLTQYMARENYEQLHYSFVMGYRFFLAPRQQCEVLTDLDPAFVSRLAELNRLRRKHAAILLRGRFLETEPLEIGTPALWSPGPTRARRAAPWRCGTRRRTRRNWPWPGPARPIREPRPPPDRWRPAARSPLTRSPCCSSPDATQGTRTIFPWASPSRIARWAWGASERGSSCQMTGRSVPLASPAPRAAWIAASSLPCAPRRYTPTIVASRPIRFRASSSTGPRLPITTTLPPGANAGRSRPRLAWAAFSRITSTPRPLVAARTPSMCSGSW